MKRADPTTIAHCALLLVAGAILAVQANDNNSKVKPEWPSFLSGCLTPMNLSQATKWREELHKGEPFNNSTSFCEEGGFFCDEYIQVSSHLLYSFSTYKSPSQGSLVDSLFFNEGLLSLGSFLQLPSFQEPPLPTKAFLHPLLRPLLFDHRTSIFPRVLLPFGFHNSTPLTLSMQQTLHLCSSPPQHNEAKACLATFEDLINFATSTIGKTNVAILSTPNLPLEEIVIVVAIKELTNLGSKVAISCHNMMFPFQVFYCHHLRGTKLFQATLQAEIGDTEKNFSALASCHPREPTSMLHNVAHINVRKGELLCHWNYGDNIVLVGI